MEPDADLGMNRAITAQTDPQTARAYWTMGRGDSVRAFRAARRHSRAGAHPARRGSARGGAGFARRFPGHLSQSAAHVGKLPVNVGNLVVSGTKITMEQPHLSGFTQDARAYELSADAAASRT